MASLPLSHVSLAVLVATLLCLGAGAGASAYSKQSDADSIIPPWVDAYGAPSATVTLYYHGNKLKPGRQYGINSTQEKPHVTIKGKAILQDHYYTLIAVDPDAPGPKNFTRKDILHWLVVNIPGAIKTSQEVYHKGDELLPYVGPGPPVGVHRYFFLLFDQGKKKIDYQAPTSRFLFSVRTFTSVFHLGFPVAGTLFRAEAGKF
eukprot:TRINITY_DN155_c0_g1_i1.p1 TRINITY_DN155_c0_g1~~TRINITY_DN155_c0_g1_i1.p1  ORF type:complete len:226 (-),score=20.50 TRINITY_DN155_c0_g1_i1:410-1021(-)